METRSPKRSLRDAVIEPGGAMTPVNLGPSAVMIATRPDVDLFNKRFVLDGTHSRDLFLSRLRFNDCSSVAMVGPMLGAPHAVMILETLIAWGVRQVIFWGWCGAVNHCVNTGDILIPTGALADEGTSRHYPDPKSSVAEPCLRPSEKILAQIETVCASLPVKTHHGLVWTTDAVYRETGARIRYYQKKDVLAVDMETSALFAVARFRQVDLGAILVVSDELSTLQWNPGFTSSPFKQGRQAACEMVKRLCQTI